VHYNVAIVHYSSPPVVGGVEEVIKQQALLFRRNLINVKIISGKGDAFEKYIPVTINPLLSSSSVEVTKAMENILKKNDFYLFENLKVKIKEFLINELKNFDILIVHNILTMRYNLPAAMAIHEIANENIVKVIGWCHDSLYFYKDYDKIYDRSPFNILKTFNENITYVAISESRKKFFANLLDVPSEKIEVVKNGIDPIDFYMLDKHTVEIIESEDLFNQDIIIVHPSRLHPRKNIELTIRVTKEIAKMGYNVKTLITGAFDPHESDTLKYYKKLNKLIKELKVENNIVLLSRYTFSSGKVIESDRVKIRDLYQLSDVLFLPSFQEGFGIPILEAGMLKIPIVCSNITPFKEIAGDYANFFELDEEPGAVARKVIDAVQKNKTIEFFRTTLKEYSWDNIFKNRIEPLFKKILKI